MQWDYWHRIEYRREIRKGHLVHEYTEQVQDHGWLIGRRGMTKDEYVAFYTRACAEDFLAHRGAEHGTWIVAVYRTFESPHGDPRLVCSIRMRWAGVPQAGCSSEEVSAGRV